MTGKDEIIHSEVVGLPCEEEEARVDRLSGELERHAPMCDLLAHFYGSDSSAHQECLLEEDDLVEQLYTAERALRRCQESSGGKMSCDCEVS
jgi:hypothetical protein